MGGDTLMNKPRVTTFKQMAKRAKQQKKKRVANKTQEQKDDFDKRFDDMCYNAADYWGLY